MKIIIEKKMKRFLPKQNAFRIFKEKITHKKFSKEEFIQRYADILRKYSGCINENTIQQSVEYKTKYLLSDSFKFTILNNIKNGTAITLLDKSNDEYINLLEQIKAEIDEVSEGIPNMREVFDDIQQIHADVSAQLEAYSTDLRGKTPQEIEECIKRINGLSLSEDKKQNIGENGYRNINVGLNINDNGVKLLSKEHVGQAMQYLVEEISDLVNFGDDLSNEEYLRKASNLMYRFIRIHPFPDSNGRTSRSLINMITLNRNIIVPFPKETKDEYTKAMKNSSIEVGYRDDNGYLESLYTNPVKARELEASGAGEIFKYVEENAITDKALGETDVSQREKKLVIEPNVIE